MPLFVCLPVSLFLCHTHTHTTVKADVSTRRASQPLQVTRRGAEPVRWTTRASLVRCMSQGCISFSRRTVEVEVAPRGELTKRRVVARRRAELCSRRPHNITHTVTRCDVGGSTPAARENDRRRRPHHCWTVGAQTAASRAPRARRQGFKPNDHEKSSSARRRRRSARACQNLLLVAPPASTSQPSLDASTRQLLISAKEANPYGNVISRFDPAEFGGLGDEPPSDRYPSL